jgi:hypothetical protein
MRWGYGGRWWSCDGEEGGESELDAPRTQNSERRAWATLTVDEARDGVGRPDSGGGAASDSGNGVVETGRGGSDSGGGAVGTVRSERRDRNGAVGTSARGPDNAFNALERRSAWQPRGNGALPGGPSADSGV